MENLYDSFATDKPTKIHHLLTASSVPRPVIGRLVPYQEDNLALMTSSLQELAASKRVLRQFSSLNCQLPSLEDWTKENDTLWKGRSRDTTTASVTGKGKHFFYRRWDRPQSHRREAESNGKQCMFTTSCICNNLVFLQDPCFFFSCNVISPPPLPPCKTQSPKQTELCDINMILNLQFYRMPNQWFQSSNLTGCIPSSLNSGAAIPLPPSCDSGEAQHT